MESSLRIKTVTLLSKLLRPLTEDNLIHWTEYQEIISNLKYLSQRGELLPPMEPRLIDQRGAAEMLGISYTSFKNMERQGKFPFKRKMVGGTSIRYRNRDVLRYMMCDNEENKAIRE